MAIQDADLELDPMDLKRLLVPLVEDQADVVFGSRFYGKYNHKQSTFDHFLANKGLTVLSNVCSGLRLTDMECCYKLFRQEIIRNININENRFGVEPELVATVARMQPRVTEMGISYAKRTYDEGKKIGIRDGIRAVFCIIYYNAPAIYRRGAAFIRSLIGQAGKWF